VRFVGEISFRLRGDRAVASQYLPQARALLGEVWQRDIVLGELSESWRTVDLSETVRISVHASIFFPPIVTIDVTPRGVVEQPFVPTILFAAWRPEGIVLTPRSALLPDGKGLPHRSWEADGAVLESYTDGGAVVDGVFFLDA